MRISLRRTSVLAGTAALLVTGVAVAPNATAGPSRSTGAHLVPHHKMAYAKAFVGRAAPTDAQCRAAIEVPCYSPQEIRTAYGLNGLLAAGDQGRGQTIVIIDSFGSPTAKQDLDQFDSDFGLPAPPSFQQLAPLGSVPFDPTDNDQVGWAEETSLDIQWAHALAPQAGIVVLTSPVSETQGVQGLPEFLKLEQYAVDHHLGKIISQSWGTTENTLETPAGRAIMARFNAFYRSATLRGITFLNSSGDSGTANPDVNGDTYPFPTVSFPSDSPWNTIVGGTSLYADTSGNYQKETVWNDGPGSATGGGVSQIVSEPIWQRVLPKADQRLLAGHRGLPDVAFNADPDTGVLVHLGFFDPDDNGYYIFGGTSEGSPAWAGIIADLNQRAGHALGFLNPLLYGLGATGLLYPAAFRDVTEGDNSQPPIPGYSAGRGWDAVTGWGTPNLSRLGGPLLRG
jgi:subtilase family serine protease